MIEAGEGGVQHAAGHAPPRAVRQALTDGRFELMTGATTPQQFGERLESAAANDRARAANPALVGIRHPVAGTVLLVLLGVAGGWFIWQVWPRKSPQRWRGL